MIHAAITGSLERCIAVLLEHYDGALPLWLSPVQVSILPISEKHAAYAQEIFGALKKSGIRAEISADDSLGKRIRKTKLEKIPCFIVVGDKEVEDKTITVENNRGGERSTLSLSDFVQTTLTAIRERANI